ncbi:Hypothetical predicted protein [Olea europaea subsp. europaea]|uniref:Uncharacterized protein n=1 Tax=Olea europaea subsp. europaea TaxID=158383 RepID=A0A8S0QHL3_OLEEU|nr:Hypothetical predicted protein [Olea europaea subsp. europaea]
MCCEQKPSSTLEVPRLPTPPPIAVRVAAVRRAADILRTGLLDGPPLSRLQTAVTSGKRPSPSLFYIKSARTAKSSGPYS